MFFQKMTDCNVTATYSLLPNGNISVLNQCRAKSPTGRLRKAVGKARVAAGSDGRKLQVSFFGPFWAPYWILELDVNQYGYALVGEPTRKFLWVLCRTPTMPEDVFDHLMELAETKYGYSLEKLIKTPQL